MSDLQTPVKPHKRERRNQAIIMVKERIQTQLGNLESLRSLVIQNADSPEGKTMLTCHRYEKEVLESLLSVFQLWEV